ncbi:MAG: prenyltransferase [Ignavibacteriae bacterium]|nr:prenyltransferase [Ignavibacteriota bacterium]
MEKISAPKLWLAQIRVNFLILAVLLVAIGWALSYKYLLAAHQGFDWFKAILLMVGSISAHASVNLFNEYSDYKTKIDFDTNKTPFSGGTGLLPGGKSKPGSVLFASILTLLISAAIGIYFTITVHWSIVLTIGIGAFAIVLYTPFLAKILLGEFFAGFALGTMVVVGTFIGMTASPGMTFSNIIPLEVWLIAIPPGILTWLLLFINEFPDVEADKKGGRFHLLILLGRKTSGYVYTAMLSICYLTIIILPIAHITSYWIYIALLTVPLAIKVFTVVLKDYDNMEKLVPALGQDVLIVLGTDLLLAVAVMLPLL